MCCEASDIWNESRPRCRFGKQCSECRGPIRKGERYLRVSSMSGGSWANFDVCESCEVLTEWMQRDCRTVCYGDLWDSLQYWDDGDISAIDAKTHGHALGLMLRHSEWMRIEGERKAV